MPRGVFKHKPLSEEHKKKISNALKGVAKEWLKGKKHSEETKRKMSEAHKGEKHWNWKGGLPKCIDCKKETKDFYSKRCRECANKFSVGENANNWRGGRTEKGIFMRNSLRYKKWRNDIFKRDEYACKICAIRNSNLIVHHIIPFSLSEENRLNKRNGITMCCNCHKDLHKSIFEFKRQNHGRKKN